MNSGSFNIWKSFNLCVCRKKKGRMLGVTRGVFEIRTDGFFWATLNLYYNILPPLFLCYARTAPCTKQYFKAERGNVLVYYLMAADYPLVSLLSWTMVVLCFMPSATTSLTAKIQIISMKSVLVVFKWTICISDLKKETHSCDTSCFQNTAPQGNQAIRQGCIWH